MGLGGLSPLEPPPLLELSWAHSEPLCSLTVHKRCRWGVTGGCV